MVRSARIRRGLLDLFAGLRPNRNKAAVREALYVRTVTRAFIFGSSLRDGSHLLFCLWPAQIMLGGQWEEEYIQPQSAWHQRIR